MFQSLQSTRLSDSVFRQVFNLITEGKLAAGDRLPPERELASAFGVSRSSVREGLRALDQLGLVDVRQGSGAFVKDTWRAGSGMLWLPWLIEHRDQVLEIVEAREIIEPVIAGVAATKASAAEKSELAQFLSDLEEALKASDVLAAVAADCAFHARIAQIANNGLLEMLVRSMHSVVHSNIAGPYHHETLIGRQALTEHATILAAIVKGDPDAATAAMRLHVSAVRRTLEATVKAANEQPINGTAKPGSDAE